MTESSNQKLSRFADLLIRFHRPMFVIAILLTIAAWPVASQLSFDRSIESLYADEDPQLNNYLESKQLFGGDELVMVAYTDPELLDDTIEEIRMTEASEQRLRGLVEQLNKVPGVQPESTQHLAHVIEQAANAEAIKIPFFRVDGLVEASINEMRGFLIGDDNKTTAVVLRLVPDDDTAVTRAETIDGIRRVATQFENENGFPISIVGEPVQIHDMFQYVEEDGEVLFRFSLILLGSVILLLFRSLRWVVLPLVIVVITIVWTEATLVISGMRLSMVSSMLNSLMTIIGIATVTHVAVNYRDHRQSMDRTDSIRATIVELTPAIFWTCTTTSVGFGVLLSSHITPVQSFGIMMALGTLLVLITASMLLPGGILMGQFSIDPNQAPAEQRLVQLLSRVTDSIQRRPKPLSIASMLLVTFASFGFFRLEVETDFSKNFRESSPIVQSLNFVETKLGGAGTWEVNFPVPEDMTTEQYMKLRDLADGLRSIGNETSGVTKAIALTDGLDLLPRRLPRPLQERILDGFQPEFRSSLYNEDQNHMRIVLRARERQSAEEKDQLIEDVEAKTDATFPGAKVTGLFVLLTFIIQSLLSDQLVSFSLALLGIGILMTIAFRSIRIGLISMVPNLFPIVAVIGAMGWCGLPINIATAMISCVSMGLTVDGTIHYIAAYRRERAKGLSVREALEATQLGVGRALVFAYLALVVGFCVLTLSNFIPLIYFGILVSVAMVGGLFGDLVLLPLLLQKIDRDEPQPVPNSTAVTTQ